MTGRKRTNQRGAVLIFAISLLAVFSVLGTAYVVRMVNESESADLRIREARARALAEAGIHAAIGDLSIAVREERQNQLLGESTYQFPAFKGVWTGEDFVLENTERVSMATVKVLDESGKANINHVPVSVLRLLLGVDGQTARLIATSLPGRPFFGGEDPESRRWLHGADELATRDWVDEDTMAAVDMEVLTSYSVPPGEERPRDYLNVNSAPAEVLAAVLDIPLEDARQVMLRRPFESIEELEKTVGKPAKDFNMRPMPGDDSGLPRPLAFHSRAFRLQAEGVFGTSTSGGDSSRAKLEAVVAFNPDGTYEITYWNSGLPPESDEAPAAAASEGESTPAAASTEPVAAALER